MNQEAVMDQLSWKMFYKHSKNIKKIKKAEPFNRLVAHSRNFYIVAGYGAFSPGYVLVISKEFIPSFGLIRKNLIGELNFMIKVSKDYIKRKYNKVSIVYEHGMCACVGGLDRAHIHIMGVNNLSNYKTLKSSIDRVLFKRKIGIRHILFNNYKLQNIHDINQIFEDKKNILKYKIVGKVIKFQDLKDLSHKNWPFNTLKHISRGGHYVYFRSGFKDLNFITKRNITTQFGREVIFENELKTNENFKRKISKLITKNPTLVPWQWQNMKFDENIVTTVNDAKNEMSIMKLNNLYDFKVV